MKLIDIIGVAKLRLASRIRLFVLFEKLRIRYYFLFLLQSAEIL